MVSPTREHRATRECFRRTSVEQQSSDHLREKETNEAKGVSTRRRAEPPDFPPSPLARSLALTHLQQNRPSQRSNRSHHKHPRESSDGPGEGEAEEGELHSDERKR